MKLCLCVYFFTVSLQSTSAQEETPIPDVRARIGILKTQIAKQIKNFKMAPIADKFDSYDYVDISRQPVTPIMDYDDRKKKEQYKMKQLKYKTTKISEENGALKPTKKSKGRSDVKYRKIKHSQHVDIFYRKQFDTSKMEIPNEYALCQDLITPFFNGEKSNMSFPKQVLVSDPFVSRLIGLINIDTTNMTKDEVYSIIYQVSNLQLRFFQWDLTALRLLFNVIIPEKKQSFANLKHGIKGMFRSWSLDISNTTNLLKQARIFRPPCVVKPNDGASTKKPRGHRYPKPSTTKKICKQYDDDENC